MVVRPSTPAEAEALIPQYYAGRSVFITGGTGFMGKVLVERLLRTCPDIGRLYLLMRPKKDQSPEKRLAQLKTSQVFEGVRAECPHQLDKLVMIPGDTMQDSLGMSPHHLAVISDVSVVFHSAATLKFDEELSVALRQNVLSVMTLMDICDRLPLMEAFIHVSTAYSNAELSVVSERVYPPRVSPARALALAAAADKEELARLTPSLIAPKPNTYTFTKALAEAAVSDHRDRKYAVAIFRPTIVISAVAHPFPGWIENLNGPSGVAVSAGKGLLHVFCCEPAARADLLPVDISIDTLIAVAWDVATTRPARAAVFNCSVGERPTRWREFESELRAALRRTPLDAPYWYPWCTTVSTKFTQKTLEFILQTVPLHLAEYTMRLFGMKNKISLITVSSRLSAMADVLRFFSMREWTFENANVRALRDKLSPADRAIYNLDVRTIDWPEHYKNFVIGTRKYLLKEKDQDLQRAKTHMNRLFWLHCATLAACGAAVVRVALRSGTLRASITLLLSLISTAYSAVAGRVA